MAATESEAGGAVRQPPPEAEPTAPTKVSAPGWRATVRRMLVETKRDRIPMIAAGVAFYWFLAVFPLLFAAVGLLQLIKASPSLLRGIDSTVTTALPGSAATILTQAIHSAQTRAGGGGLAALVIGVALALWSASSGMAATQVGMDVAYDVPEDRKFLKKRMMAIVMILVAFVLGGIAVALLVFGQPLGVWVERQIVGGAAFLWLWTAIRWILTILAVLALFAVFYHLGPNRKAPSWSWVSPGGILAGVIWLAASVGFSLYVSNFGGAYAKTYGALLGVIVLMLWLYLTSLALLLGAELNGELERQRAIEASQAGDRSAPPTDRPVSRAG